MSTYEDLGFSNTLSREPANLTQISESDAELNVPTPASTQLISGKTGELQINLEQDKITETTRGLERQLHPNIDLVVAQDGSGDFGDIQQAIDYAVQIGGATILIKSGTYLMLSYIQMKDNIHLVGEDSRNTVLDFKGSTRALGPSGVGFSGLAGVVADGILVLSNTTLTLTNGSITVATADPLTGVAVGDKASIGGSLYSIVSIPTLTSFTIPLAYQGVSTASSVDNVMSSIIRPVKNISIENLTIRNGSDAGLYCVRTENATVKDVTIDQTTGGNGIGFYFDGNFNLSAFNIVASNNGGSGTGINQNDGIMFANTSSFSSSVVVTGAKSFNNKNYGFYIDAADEVSIEAGFAESNKKGFVLDSLEKTKLTDCRASNNKEEGFYLTGNSNSIISTKCKDNVLASCLAWNNGGDGFRIHDASDGGAPFGQTVDLLTRNIFSSCNAINNALYGFKLSFGGGADSTGLTDNRLIGCSSSGNISGTISDSASRTTREGNYGIDDVIQNNERFPLATQKAPYSETASGTVASGGSHQENITLGPGNNEVYLLSASLVGTGAEISALYCVAHQGTSVRVGWTQLSYKSYSGGSIVPNTADGGAQYTFAANQGTIITLTFNNTVGDVGGWSWALLRLNGGTTGISPT